MIQRVKGFPTELKRLTLRNPNIASQGCVENLCSWPDKRVAARGTGTVLQFGVRPVERRDVPKIVRGTVRWNRTDPGSVRCVSKSVNRKRVADATHGLRTAIGEC